jgi:hypothetical protein
LGSLFYNGPAAGARLSFSTSNQPEDHFNPYFFYFSHKMAEEGGIGDGIGLGSIDVVDTTTDAEPVQWIVDVLHEPTGEWFIGNASSFFPAQSSDEDSHLLVDVEFDDKPLSTKLPLNFKAVRLIECDGGPNQDLFDRIVHDSSHNVQWLVKICTDPDAADSIWEDSIAIKVVLATNMIHLKSMPEEGIPLDETVHLMEDSSNGPEGEASKFFQHIMVCVACCP